MRHRCTIFGSMEKYRLDVSKHRRKSAVHPGDSKKHLCLRNTTLVHGSKWIIGACQSSRSDPAQSIAMLRLLGCHTADMWSLGAVLLSLLRGSTLPFDPPGLGSARLHAGMLPDAFQTWLDGKLEQLDRRDHAGVGHFDLILASCDEPPEVAGGHAQTLL